MKDAENQKPGQKNCPLASAIHVVGGKWKMHIIWFIFTLENPRFTQLKRAIEGITNTMLAQSLKELEQDGMIQRWQYNEIPPRVEYTLTEKAKSVMPILEELATWAASYSKIETI